jgi:hypothetical protein
VQLARDIGRINLTVDLILVRSIMSNSGQSPLGAALFVLLTICITQPSSSLLQQKYGLTTGLKCNALVARPILRSNTKKFLELRYV